MMGDPLKWLNKVKVGVILPSRGLMFSQTADELLQNLKGIPHRIYFSHRKPIPECFEKPANKALIDEDITHLWFVEDDMVLAKGTLEAMLKEDANAVTCDYPVTKDGRGAVFYDKGGRVVFCGTGCLLVKREVFFNLKTPYFTDKVKWNMQNYGESIKLTAVNNDTNDGYGLHDITFSVKLWNAGIIIKVCPIRQGQRKLLALGKSGSNDGAHKYEVWRKVVKNARLKALMAQPIALGAKSKLVTLDTPTGAITTSQKHAENLVAQGLAQYPPRRFTIIDDSEVEI